MLNEQQQAIVDYVVNESGNLNVIARAGCGKTFTLVEGVVKAIAENQLGSAVLMAFNKSAANEFESRIMALAKETGNSRLLEVETGTVHKLGFAAWRKFVGGRVNVDGWKVANIIRNENGSDWAFTAQTSKLVSLAKQAVLTPDSPSVEWEAIINHHDIDANGNANEIVEAAIKALSVSNATRNTIDFDDMIYLPVVFDVRVTRFDFVLIDEAQDTNAARRLLAFKMLKDGGRLIAVGDDKQAIYGFTGADSDSMEIIQESLNSETLPLSITYRCPASVVAEANRLVPDLVAHPTAPLGSVRTIPSFTYGE